jgi:hypothetical protein
MASLRISSDCKKAVLHSLTSARTISYGNKIAENVKVVRHEDGTDRVLDSGVSDKVGTPILSHTQPGSGADFTVKHGYEMV